MLYCLRRPCGVSDRPSAPLNSTCLSMLCAAYLRLMAKVTSPFPSLLRDSLGRISRKPLFSHDKGETRSPAGFFLFSDFLPRGSRPLLRLLLADTASVRSVLNWPLLRSVRKFRFDQCAFFFFDRGRTCFSAFLNHAEDVARIPQPDRRFVVPEIKQTA